MAIEDKEILKDCSSCSQVLIGQFTGQEIKTLDCIDSKILLTFNIEIRKVRQEAVFLRGNDTLELYAIENDKFEYITKYEITTAKV